MTLKTSLPKTQRDGTTVLIASTIFITLFLFFIDEGYCNFSWMTNIGNWIVFIVYALAIFSGQLLIHRVILKKYKWSGKTLLSVIGGAIIGVLFVVEVVFTDG